MSEPRSPFTAIYTEWLDSFRAMIPGATPAGLSEHVKRKEEKAAANQEWEGEGGSVKAVPVAECKDAPKIPF